MSTSETKTKFVECLERAKFRLTKNYSGSQSDYETGSSYLEYYDIGSISTQVDRAVRIAVLEAENRILDRAIGMGLGERRELIIKNERELAELKDRK